MRAERDRQIAVNSARRVHLIDLVLAVVFCGLVVATFTSPQGFRESNFTFLAAVVVGIFWYLLEQAFGQLSAPWLQAGVAASLAASHDRGDLCGLNRRMLAALSERTEWSETLFTVSANQISKLLLRTNDRRSFRKSEQFNEQAWSIVEYLAGEQAPETQKAAFRAFVKDKRQGPARTGVFPAFRLWLRVFARIVAAVGREPGLWQRRAGINPNSQRAAQSSAARDPRSSRHPCRSHSGDSPMAEGRRSDRGRHVDRSAAPAR